jgi:hypothetical protein
MVFVGISFEKHEPRSSVESYKSMLIRIKNNKVSLLIGPARGFPPNVSSEGCKAIGLTYEFI